MKKEKAAWDITAAENLKKLILSHFRSLRAAARELGVDHSHLARVVKAEAAPSETLIEKIQKLNELAAQPFESRSEQQNERKLINFSDPDCPAWRYAVATVLKWRGERQNAYQNCRFATREPLEAVEDGQPSHSYKVVVCNCYQRNPFDEFLMNVLLFFRLGNVISPVSARGLLVELPDLSEGDFVDWIQSEVAKDATARRLFFHAVLFTENPFLYVVDGGILQVDPGIRFANPESVISIPRFGIENIKKFLQNEERL